MKNTILYTLFCLIGVLTVKAQNDFELTIDSPTVVAGEDLIINYTYSSTEDGRITFSIGLYDNWAVIDDDVAWGEVNVTAGSNETGTIAIPIGADVTPSSDLTGSHLYRIGADLYSNGQWRVWAGGTVTVNEATQTQTPITTDISFTLDNETVEAGNPLVVNVDYSYAEAGKIALALLEFDENGIRDETHLTASFDVQAGEDQSESINFDMPTTLVPSANLDQGHYYILDVSLNDSNDNFVQWGGSSPVTLAPAAQTIQTAISYSVQSGAIDPGNEVIVTVTYSYAEAGKIVVSILEMDENDEKVETRFSNSVDISAGVNQIQNVPVAIPTDAISTFNLPSGHKYLIDVALNDSNDNFVAWGGQNIGITLSNVVLTNNQFHTYPNPVVDELYIQSETKVNGIKIYNLVGKFVKQVKHVNNNKIEIGDLDSGIYLLHIHSDSHHSKIKIVKR